MSNETAECPAHWFGRATAPKTAATILEANGIPKAVMKSVKGMFGRRERIVVRPGYELKAAHGTTPLHVEIHAASIHVGMSVCATVPDTDAIRKAVAAFKASGLTVRFHTYDREDYTLSVGKGQPPESFRPGDDWWQKWVRERMPRWYTEEAPAWLDRTTVESMSLAKQSANDIRTKVSADLGEAMKGIL